MFLLTGPMGIPRGEAVRIAFEEELGCSPQMLHSELAFKIKRLASHLSCHPC